MQRLRRLRLEKPAILHLDAAANPKLEPGHGFATWTGADHLLTSRARALLATDADLYARAAAAAPVEAAAPRLYCVLREVSAQHLLLAGVLPMLGAGGKRALSELPVGETPSLSQLDLGNGHDPRKPAPPRCLCCAQHLRRSARHSGAVCAPLREVLSDRLYPGSAQPPLMREAREWFKYDFEAWLPDAGCHDDALRAAKRRPASGEAVGDGSAAAAAAARPGRLPSQAMYACLDKALVCPKGHALLAYELYEREDGSSTEEEWEGGEEEGEEEDQLGDETDEDDPFVVDEDEDEDEEASDEESDESDSNDSSEMERWSTDAESNEDPEGSAHAESASDNDREWRRQRRSRLHMCPSSSANTSARTTPLPPPFAY